MTLVPIVLGLPLAAVESSLTTSVDGATAFDADLGNDSLADGGDVGYRRLSLGIDWDLAWRGAASGGHGSAASGGAGEATPSGDTDVPNANGRAPDRAAAGGGPPRRFGPPPVSWLHSFSIERLDIDYDLLGGGDRADGFLGLGYRSRFTHRFHDRYSYTLFGAVEVAADDLGEVDAGDLNLSAGAQIGWQATGKLILGLGVFYTESLGEERVLPFPFLMYVDREHGHRVSLRGPRLDYAYTLSSAHTVGAFVQYTSTEALVLDGTVPDHTPSGAVRVADQEVNVELTEVVAGIRYAYESPSSGLSLGAEAGGAFAREFTMVGADDGDTLRQSDGSEVDFDPEPTLILRVKAAYRF